MPAFARALNQFTIARSAPAFSGRIGQIDHRTAQGKTVDEDGALRVAAVWIAVTVLADEIASLPLRIVQRDDRQRTPLRPAELRALWSDDPNPDQTRYGLEATEILSMNLWGYSASMLGWTRSGALETRWAIDPTNVSIERLDDGGMKLSAPGQGELQNRVGQRPEFVWCPRYVLPGQLMPVSPVRYAATQLNLVREYDAMASKLAQEGFNPSAVLTFGDAVPPDIAKQYSSELLRLHGGSGRSGGVAVIGGPGPKLERWGMSMVDAEFVAQNERVFRLVMAMWRVPPTIAGMVDKPSTWGSGIAEFTRGWERFALRPIANLRAAALQKYVTQWVDPRLQVRYVFDGLLSASPVERTEMQRQALQAGMTSVERVLAQNDEPPFGEEETVYSQLALATEEDRRLERLRRQAETYASLVAAGVDREYAATATGFDPALIGADGAA